MYIPETTYLTGILLGGVAVSTGVGSKTEPVPVAIKLTGRGNLSKDLKIKIENCRILGSSYGDLSSERIVIRAETMICHNHQDIITTKIAGIIYGDDGANGIKGTIVDISSKHLNNAFIGGFLSGFAGTVKSSPQFAISTFGNINSKKNNIIILLINPCF